MSWTLEELNWEDFEVEKAPISLLPLIKASSLVEYNADDYGHYLKRVFKDDPFFLPHIDQWVEEEKKHGLALAQWAYRLDPSFDLEASLKRFQQIFRIDLDASSSIRGSNAGEFMARCIVETGTTSFYTALAEASQEPMLRKICFHIASDEWIHYKLFYSHLKRCLSNRQFSRLQRLKIAYQRLKESESDELASAYYAANISEEEPYCHKKFISLYLGKTYPLYRPVHIRKALQMISKAAGLSAQGRWIVPSSHLFCAFLKAKGAFLRMKNAL